MKQSIKIKWDVEEKSDLVRYTIKVTREDLKELIVLLTGFYMGLVTDVEFTDPKSKKSLVFQADPSDDGIQLYWVYNSQKRYLLPYHIIGSLVTDYIRVYYGLNWMSNIVLPFESKEKPIKLDFRIPSAK